jgi:hypothetical protein
MESNSPKLNNADIGLLARAVDGDDRHPLDPVLDRVGHMGHDLHRPAKVVAATLLVDDIQVDLAGRDVVLAGEANGEIPLVVAEIKVDLAACTESDFVMSHAATVISTHQSTEQSTRRARRGP